MSISKPTVQEAAISARKRMRVTEGEKKKRERAAKKAERMGRKVWVDITQQPKRTGKSYMGRASFHRQKDRDKKKHSVNIMTGGPAKLKIKGKDLVVKPKDGEEYIYGGDKEDKKEDKKADDKPSSSKLKLAPPLEDTTGDGVEEAARVGVPSRSVPTPPALPRLPNLTEAEKAIEGRAIDAFEKDPEGVADQYMKMIESTDSNKFVTDDAKLLFPDYTPKGKSPDEVAASRARHNVLLHQVANAIAKRAFVKKLDDLAKLDDDDPAKSVLVTSGGVGCHRKDTLILMYDGSTKMVQDIMLGDQLMGPDSEPRNVLQRINGHGKMYRVTPIKGKSFVVNEDHVLSIQTKRVRGGQKRTKMCTVNMTVKEILARGRTFKRDSWLYRTGIDFKESSVPLDPYFLGIRLGDGTHTIPAVTAEDHEIVSFMEEFTERFPKTHLHVRAKPNNNSSDYRISVRNGSGNKNPVTKSLKEIGVLGNKHIPMQYKVNSREVRLALLAGLIDSDGHYTMDGCYDFISKYEHLSNDVAFICRSLGMAAYVKQCEKTGKNINFTGTYYRVSISGHLDEIPTKIARKQAKPRLQKKSVLRTGYSLDPVGEDDYYGFTLDADNLYLLDDFTVTHNSGKGFALKQGPQEVKDKVAGMGAVWDAAGEQNATENPWIIEEARKRGIKATFLFVDSDPEKTWAGDWGVVNRAATPPPKGEGRMVDARLFADSYSNGAKNMKAFMDAEKDSDDLEFIVINSRGGKPELVDSISDTALNLKSDDIYKQALKAIDEGAAPTEAIKHGATIGKRIWRDPGMESTSAKVTLAATLDKLSAEKEQSKLQKEYREFFTTKLAAYGAKSPSDLDEDKRKQFFNEVEAEWEEGKGPVKSKAAVAVKAGPAEDLANQMLENFEHNVENQDDFYSDKWTSHQKMMDHQLVQQDDGALAKPAQQAPAGDADGAPAVEAPTVAARADAVAELLSYIAIPSDVLLSVEEAAEVLSAAKMTKSEQKKMAREAKKRGDKLGLKIWVEITSQPEKTRGGNYVGRATFHWQKGKDKDKKHSQMINVGSKPGARLSVKSRKLQVKPKGGEAYFYGMKDDDKGSSGKKEAAAMSDADKKSADSMQKYLDFAKENPESANEDLLETVAKGVERLEKKHGESDESKAMREALQDISSKGVSEEEMAQSGPVKNLEKMIEDGDDGAKEAAADVISELDKKLGPDSDLAKNLADKLASKDRAPDSANYSEMEKKLIKLANEADDDIRVEVAKDEKTPAEALVKLAKDKNSYVRTLVAENPSTPSSTLVELAKEEGETRHGVAGNPSTPSDLLVDMANGEDVGLRGIVAQHPLPPEVFAELAKDEEFSVRKGVAASKSAPPEILADLAKDEDKYVRHAAGKTLESLKQ